MSVKTGDQILGGRYRVLATPVSTDDVSTSWVGVDEYDTKYLLKLWPFDGETPDQYKHALWDAELRTLYRVGSSPGAEETILIIRDAGLDRAARCFVMVLEARGPTGYETLASVFPERSRFPWLSNRDPQARRETWQGLQRLGDGLQLLHDQYVLHRNVGPEAVFFSPQLGPSSLRLGGFEWSIRLGLPQTKAPPAGWSSPPEFFAGSAYGYRQETDWYAFGILAVRCLLNIEPYAKEPPPQRHQRVLRELEKATARQLSDLERTFLLRLIDADPASRLARGYEVRTAIKDILAALEYGADPGADTRPLVVVIDPTNQDLVEQAQRLEFVSNEQQPKETFNPLSPLHVANLTTFIQRDLAAAQLYAVPRKNFYILTGARLTLMLVQFEYTDKDSNTRVQTWDLSYCPGVGQVRRNEGGSGCVKLPEGVITVRTVRQIHTDRQIRQNARSWERNLPSIDRAIELRASLARFHEFIRCTNQLELLLRDAEIFRYKVVERDDSQPGLERIVIRESPRRRPVPSFCAVEGGLIEFLEREIESRKQDCDLVVLTGPDEDALIIGRSVPKEERWKVTIDPQQRRVILARQVLGAPLPPAPDEGNLRTWGMFGQVSLIRRRKRAIDRLEKHSYLLRSVSAPGQVYMDTGPTNLPVPLSVDLVDAAKQTVMQDILRVRPIYALQGPPGTGKTTLVAHLVRQILKDDPVTQILITAQAHGAVDVLRAKVRDEAFQGAEQPLAVRLGFDPDESGMTEGSVEWVSLRILTDAKGQLAALPVRSALQQEWLQAAETMMQALESWRPDREAPDFCELVKRGASLTYCTTSAGDLEVLAEGTQSFDWSIVEEAGKAHGFDLALPLQAGHRWLLIGDHKQLEPYRFEAYSDGIARLDETVTALEQLSNRAGGLLDLEWVRSWWERSTDERGEFQTYAKDWLKTFNQIFDLCELATGDKKLTIDRAEGAMAGMLSRQYRMHPTIGDLISGAYYEDKLVNCTVDDQGRPKPQVVHPFDHPAGVAGKAIVWLDTPWAGREQLATEQGPRSQPPRPRYTNPFEARVLKDFLSQLRLANGQPTPEKPLSLAVLSPYNQQVTSIRNELRSAALPPSTELKQNLRVRRQPDGSEAGRLLAHTVDSFQGNEADIIVVSLVRNNTLPAGEEGTLGFLKMAPRLNVLLSRAERLLVLIGSWEFFQQQVAAVSLDDRYHTLWHWKKVLTLLEGWFQSGAALRLNAAPGGRMS